MSWCVTDSPHDLRSVIATAFSSLEIGILDSLLGDLELTTEPREFVVSCPHHVLTPRHAVGVCQLLLKASLAL